MVILVHGLSSLFGNSTVGSVGGRYCLKLLSLRFGRWLQPVGWPAFCDAKTSRVNHDSQTSLPKCANFDWTCSPSCLHNPLVQIEHDNVSWKVGSD